MNKPDRTAGTPNLQSETAGCPTFAEAFRCWLKLGFICFGGSTGQIAILQTELVEKKRWISHARFLHALNFCMLLPGSDAQQLAIYIGWLLHRTWGGIVAGSLFIIPSMFILWGLSCIYVTYGSIGWLAAIFYGVKAAVMAIVAYAVIRIGSTVLKNLVMWSIAALAFVAIFFLKAPFPAIVITAAAIGYFGGKYWQEQFFMVGEDGTTKQAQQPVLDDDRKAPEHVRPSLYSSLRVGATCLLLWWLPVLLLGFWNGWNGILFQEGLFFSKATVVTLGVDYAMLPYVAQHSVEHHGWLTTSQVMDGLGMAETTPGPLIMATQFIGFVGAWNNPGNMSPLTAATLGALIATWTTFLPCFFWTLLGAPYIEQVRGNIKMSSALASVTAAVVGVLLNLAVWFGIHVMWSGNGAFDWFALGVSGIAFVGLLKWQWDVIPVVIGAGILGLLYKTLL